MHDFQIEDGSNDIQWRMRVDSDVVGNIHNNSKNCTVCLTPHPLSWRWVRSRFPMGAFPSARRGGAGGGEVYTARYMAMIFSAGISASKLWMLQNT